jgi:hypothetical protein
MTLIMLSIENWGGKSGENLGRKIWGGKSGENLGRKIWRKKSGV